MIAFKQRQNSKLIAAIAVSVLSFNIAGPAYAADDLATGSATVSGGSFVVADAHPYRHCHNLPKRTYCHKADRLPQNWPPHTDTPHRSGYESDSRKDCPAGSRRCGNGNRYDKG
jgi:hypothetical protein